jgi:HEAT repeat protein
MTPRGKAIALSTAAVGLVVLVMAGIVAKDRILEEWYLHKLRLGDDQEKLYAAEKLAEIKSVSAVPALLGCLRVELHGRSTAYSQWTLGEQACRLQESLARIGKPALPDLLRAVGNEDAFVAFVAASSLEWVYYQKKPSGIGGPGCRVNLNWCIDPVVRFLRDDEKQTKEVRQTAAEALKKIEGTRDERKR